MYPTLKLGLPFVVMAQPLAYLAVTAKDGVPWLVGMGIYMVGFMLVMARYEGFLYRVGTATLWGHFLANLCVAISAACVYAWIMTGSLDGLFEVR